VLYEQYASSVSEAIPLLCGISLMFRSGNPLHG